MLVTMRPRINAERALSGSRSADFRLLGTLARGWFLHVSLPILLLLGVIAVVAPDLIVMPSLTSRVVTYSPTGSLFACLATVAVLSSTQEPVTLLSETSPRRMLVWRIGRLSALTCLAFVVTALPWPDLAVACLSTLMALIGEGLVLSRLAGPSLSWALPVLHLGASVVFGFRSDGSLQPWAWIISVDPPAASLILSAVLWFAGVYVWARAPADVA